MRDREPGRSYGFGFVICGNQMAADAAIHAMNEQQLDGRGTFVRSANGSPDRCGLSKSLFRVGMRNL